MCLVVTIHVHHKKYLNHVNYSTCHPKHHEANGPHALLVNTPCSYLHSFCVSGVNSGLATNHGGVWESLLHEVEPTFDFIFVV